MQMQGLGTLQSREKTKSQEVTPEGNKSRAAKIQEKGKKRDLSAPSAGSTGHFVCYSLKF